MRIHYDNIPGMNLSPHRYTKKWSVPTSGAVRLPRMLKASSSSFRWPTGWRSQISGSEYTLYFSWFIVVKDLSLLPVLLPHLLSYSTYWFSFLLRVCVAFAQTLEANCLVWYCGDRWASCATGLPGLAARSSRPRSITTVTSLFSVVLRDNCRLAVALFLVRTIC